MVAHPTPLQTLLEQPWLERLLLCAECEQLREEACKIVVQIATIYPERALPLLDTLCKLLPTAMLTAATKGGDVTVQYFRAFVKLIQNRVAFRLYLAENGFLDILCQAILTQARRIEAVEHSADASFTCVTQGFALRIAVGLLSALLSASPGVRARFGRRGLIGPMLEAFLALRGLVAQKAKLTDESAAALLAMLMSFREAGEADQMLFMRACVSALSSSAAGRRAPAFVLEQLCNIVSPPKPEPEYLLNLQKARSQEEFIRGTMDKNPYSSREVGPLMRDVKNKICMTLDLRGLIDDDNGMELLVDKQIIKLDLPVARVYDQVWRPAHKDSPPNSPMTVVFRLQGLDGEATEPIIDTIPETASSATPARDPEDEFKIAAVMADCGGLEAVLTLLGRVNAAQLVRDRDLVILAFKLLALCTKIEVNRRRLLQINAIPAAVSKLRDALVLLNTGSNSSGASGSGGPAASTAAVVTRALEEIADAALHFAEPLAARGGCSTALLEEDFDGLLSALALPVVVRNVALSTGLRSLVPNIAGGNVAFARRLVAHFSQHLNLDAHDAAGATPSAMQCFIDICAAAPAQLKSLLATDLGVTRPLVELLVRRFPASGGWEAQLSKPSTTAALRLLLALTTSHAPTQELLLACGAVPVLHALEGVRTAQAGGGAGLIAENIMDAIADSATAKAAVEACRDATKKAKLALARKKREEILRTMGLKQKTGTTAASGPEAQQTVVVAGATPSSVETLQEERGLACVICREGYSFRPKDVLGFYTLEKPCSVGGVGGRPFVNSATNLAMIHIRCHEDATKAERKKKQPLDEWDAAQLRNQTTRCNNIFPVRGPEVTDDGYAAAMERYWGTIGGMVSGPTRSRGSSSSSSSGDLRLRILLQNLRCTMWRYCVAVTDQSPAASPAPSASPQPVIIQQQQQQQQDAGGREPGLRMCAFMVQMALHLLSSADMDRTVTQFLEMPEAAAGAQQPDGALFVTALSVVITTSSQWRRNKLDLVRRVMAASFAERPPPLPASSSATASEDVVVVPDTAELFRSCRPALLYMSLAERIHAALRRNVADQPTANGAWLEALRTALVNDPTAAGDAVGSVLGQFDSAPAKFTQFAEFFADIGMLEVVKQSVDVSAGTSPADLFVSDLFKTIRQQQKHS